VKFFQKDPVWDILFPSDRKFVFVRNKKTLSRIFLFSQTDPVWNILTYRKSWEPIHKIISLSP